ncbi:MAG: CHC2 zinc finger domain-containing protein [Chloroflexota bacterium]
MATAIDVRALKWAHPLAAVMAAAGVELAPRGRFLMGRCPFHDDHTPSFLVDATDQHFHCFGCSAHGDVLDFVMRSERLDFRRAVERLTGGGRPVTLCPLPPRRVLQSARPWGPEERACVAAAVELYSNQLLAEPAALAYAAERGIERATLERCRAGYAAGDTLAAYLRWRRLSCPAARRAGLLDRAGRERLAGRLVLPECRAGRPVWLIGRTVAPPTPGPKYLGLPGRKPLLGWEAAQSALYAVVVEGVFDLLTLRQWDLPAVALAGTHVRPAAVEALRRFPRLYLALDGDAAGRVASAALSAALGERAIPLALPGVQDVAELAPRPDGRNRFIRALSDVRRAPAA